jgi:hypothetical protein
MKLPPHVWKQLKNLTADALIRALEKDGWVPDEKWEPNLFIATKTEDGSKFIIIQRTLLDLTY